MRNLLRIVKYHLLHPISVSLNNGRNDEFIIMTHINDLLINDDINNKYKKYMLADTIYDISIFKNI